MKSRKILVLILVAFLPALFKCPARRGDDAARIHFLVGSVEVFSGGTTVRPIVGGVLSPREEIATGKKSFCDLLFSDVMFVRVGESTRALVGDIGKEARMALDVSKGRVMVIVTRLGRESLLRVKGSTATIAVRGTVFAFDSAETANAVSVLNGKVEMEIADGRRAKKIEIVAGDYAELRKDFVEDVLSGRKTLTVRKLSYGEKKTLLNELAVLKNESLGFMPSHLRDAFFDEIAKAFQSDSAQQKRAREAGLKEALRRAEEARKKAELEEALRKKKEEEERLKKEAEEAERKKIEAARKAAAKKRQDAQKPDRSADTSGN